MKFMLGLIAVIVIVLILLFKLGLFTGEDPKAAAEALHKSVTPGMTWQQVVDIRAPKKFAKLRAESLTGTSAPRKFDRAMLEDGLADGEYPEGFTFPYTFSAGEAVQVVFDDKGKVIGVEDMPTAKDLFSPH